MPLFAKKTTEPEPPASQEVVLYEPPIQPSAAPKASDLEREIRREIWQHMSPQLAHSAGLSLPELIDYVSGAARLSTVQVEALARHMGIIKTPPTDIDKIRARLNVELKKALGFSRLEWPGGGKGADDLRSFVAGENCLTFDELNRLAREFWMNRSYRSRYGGTERLPRRRSRLVEGLRHGRAVQNVPGLNENGDLDPTGAAAAARGAALGATKEAAASPM